MADKPILFSGPMIEALVAGRKTQTRRVIKPQPTKTHLGGWIWETSKRSFFCGARGIHEHLAMAVPINIGDRLWVRETFARTSVSPILETIDNPMVVYPVCHNTTDYGGPWKPSIHMPRSASRITLRVTDVRVQRLTDIDEADAIAEGAPIIPEYRWTTPGMPMCSTELPYKTVTPLRWFHLLWDGLNAQRGFGWEVNPWVVAYTFTVHFGNIDTIGVAA